jgi:hypothetical protein
VTFATIVQSVSDVAPPHPDKFARATLKMSAGAPVLARWR